MKMTALRRAMLVAVPLVVALFAASAAFAEQPRTVDCILRFQLSGWSAIFERVDGTGIIACADGTALPVFVEARGPGLTHGKPKITNGTGKFAGAHQISDAVGSYAQRYVQVAVVTSDDAQLLSNGKVSLVLTGSGQGPEPGVRITGFTIRPQ